MIAAVRGDATIVQALVAHGADINTRDRNGETVLSTAAEKGHVSVIEVLLDKGADVNAKNEDGSTALHLAVGQGHEAIVQALLAERSDVHAKDSRVRTPLLVGASRGHTAIMQSLLDHGAEVNAADKGGRTALILAAQQGHEATAHILLEYGADVHAKDDSGVSALVYADVRGYPSLVQALLEAEGAEKLRKQGSMPHDQPNDTEVVSLIYIEQNMDKCDLKIWNPITQATNLLVTLKECPDDVFVVEDANTVIIATEKTIQEIGFRQEAIIKSPIQLPFKNPKIIRTHDKRLILSGYLKDGRLVALYEAVRPADDSDMYLYAFDGKEWVLVEEKYCGRFGTFGDCILSPMSSRGWRSWKKESQVWHPKLAFNPFVVARGIAKRTGTGFIHNEGTYDPHHKGGWKYVKFSFNGLDSILYHSSERGAHNFGLYTFSIYLQTDQDSKPVELTTDQCNTAIESKYLLLYKYFGGGLHLIDLETGERPLEGLKFASWVH